MKPHGTVDTRWIEYAKIAAVLIAAAGLFLNLYDGMKTRQLAKRQLAYEISAGYDRGEVLAARTALKVAFQGLQDMTREKALTRIQADSLFVARRDTGSAGNITHNQIVTVLNYFEDMCIGYRLGTFDREYIEMAYGSTIPKYEEFFREFIDAFSDSTDFPMWESITDVAETLRKKKDGRS